MRFTHHIGGDAAPYFKRLAELRIEVFREFPYLYDGDFEYEESYLNKFFASERSFLCLAWNENKIVGASTALPLADTADEFQKPFVERGMAAETIFYFGESVLLPSFRAKGAGKTFFAEREAYAMRLGGFRTLAFCAVIRPASHRMRPASYRPLDTFWNKMGFFCEPDFVTHYAWKDVGNTDETEKKMQFWCKHYPEKE